MKPCQRASSLGPTYLPPGGEIQRTSAGQHWRAARTRHARSARASSFSSFFQIDSFVHVRRTYDLVRIDIERYISAPPWTIDRNSRSRPLIARCTQCRPLCAIVPSQVSSSPPVRRGAEREPSRDREARPRGAQAARRHSHHPGLARLARAERRKLR